MKEKFHIAFISGKLGHVDGVSLEVEKWIVVLQELGHQISVIAGEFSHLIPHVPKENHFLIPEIGFDTAIQYELAEQAFPHISGKDTLTIPINIEAKNELEMRIWREGTNVANKIQGILYENNIDVMIAENTNALPMTILAGVAIHKIATERNMACIFHHHDFWWERSRYCDNHISELLHKVMPPRDPGVEHIVISSYAEHVLFTFKRINAHIIPNCEDFLNPPVKDEYNSTIREDFGIKDDELFVLQPTRIVPRKKIEDSIYFLSRFVQKFPEYKGKTRFIISLYSGDEGRSYLDSLKKLAEEEGIRLDVVSDRVAAVRGTDPQGQKIYTNRDVLVQADLVTYLPIWEGFGNALLEAWSAKVLTVVSAYLVYKTDIRPISPRSIELNNNYDDKGRLIIAEKPLSDLYNILQNPVLKKDIIEHNFRVAKDAFSLENLKVMLNRIITDYGDEIRASRHRMRKAGYTFSV